MSRHRFAVLLLFVAACRAVPDVHVAAAGALTHRYARSDFAKWNIRASATGRDCRVLLVEAAIVLDESMVEAMHYGTGPYALDGRGVESLSQDDGFRGVVYKDPTRRVFTYGDLRDDDPYALPPCRP